MNKSTNQVDHQSDSDLSLQLSDASSLSSDSDLYEIKTNKPKKPTKKFKGKTTKKKKRSKKDESKYCVCRRGYNGKEFMIECEECKEWFHGACVGLKPNSITEHYFCKSCTGKQKQQHKGAGKALMPPNPNKKSIIILPLSKPASAPITPPSSAPKSTIPLPAPSSTTATSTSTAATIPAISKLSINDDEDDEELDDICVLCDGDCTCGAVDSNTTSIDLKPLPLPSASTITSQTEPSKTQTKIVIPIPKKSKKSKKTNLWTVKVSTTDNTSSSNSSSSSDESDAPNHVVERVGIDIKKPKKKTKKKNITQRRGKSTTLLTNIIRQKAPPAVSIASKGGKRANIGKGKRLQAIKLSSSEEDSEEELIVDDLDDLLETMSPLSEHSQDSNLESEEFFTDDNEEATSDIIEGSPLTMSPYSDSRVSYSSSTQIDSGDDEDIENEETQQIINEMTLNSDEELNNSMDEGGIFVEDDYEDDEYSSTGFDEYEEEEEEEDVIGYYGHWSSSDDEEDEEFDYTTPVQSEEDSEEDRTNLLFPLIDSEGNSYNNITAAFIQALASTSDIPTGNTTGTNTPVLGEDCPLSAFELTNALTALSAETSRQRNDEFLRRPSLPSSTVSAARRMRGSQDFSTSEALQALSALTSDVLPLALEPIDETEGVAGNDNENKTDRKDEKLSIDTSVSATIMPESATTPSGSLTDQMSPLTSSISESQQSLSTEQLALSFSADPKLQEQILNIFKNGIEKSISLEGEVNSVSDITSAKKPINTTNTTNNITTTTTTTPTTIYSNSSRHILPKPSGSGNDTYFPTISTSTLEQQIQEALNQTIETHSKRKATEETLDKEKKRRTSRSNSLNAIVANHLQPMGSTSFSTPASPAAIIDELEDMDLEINKEEEKDATAVTMDDLVDTSQLYSRSLSRSPSPEVEDNPYSKDLSRWQRIPIGAFRLMRSKNKLWLER
ncbi:MAG: hypothetical protein EXX96DRAFT_554069 [Benjaminiella poitrasii]|nr:MAG: hypothetical protein EXX96DRAFT_554069 [Benjaminiella poitrasii]